ncbi:hypothetical protein [Mycolicibacterium gadium]|uniref:hypothetical protein n=1 Tax=Mycolicibacterium gadium TaxID=1794 RepID=UPI002FDDBC43
MQPDQQQSDDDQYGGHRKADQQVPYPNNPHVREMSDQVRNGHSRADHNKQRSHGAADACSTVQVSVDRPAVSP